MLPVNKSFTMSYQLCCDQCGNLRTYVAKQLITSLRHVKIHVQVPLKNLATTAVELFLLW